MRLTKEDQVYMCVLKDIKNGKFVVGTRLKEEDLAKKFQSYSRG